MHRARLGWLALIGLVCGCGTTEPVCEPAIGIEFDGIYNIDAIGPTIFVAFDTVKADLDGAAVYGFLESFLIHGQASAGSAVWRIDAPPAGGATYVFQLAGTQVPNAAFPITGGPTATSAGQGPALDPSEVARFRLETALGAFEAVDGTLTITSTAPLFATLSASLKTAAGQTGTIGAHLTTAVRDCP